MTTQKEFTFIFVDRRLNIARIVVTASETWEQLLEVFSTYVAYAAHGIYCVERRKWYKTHVPAARMDAIEAIAPSSIERADAGPADRRRKPGSYSAANGFHVGARVVEPDEPKPLQVVMTSFPESNGKRNWTAMFKRIEPFDGLVGTCGGVTIDHGECWNRVAYAAERARVLLGLRMTEPDILEYGKDVATPDEWQGTDPESMQSNQKADE